MACPINWSKYYADMSAKGIGQADAESMMLAGSTTDDKQKIVIDAIHSETASPTLIQTGLGDYNTEKATIRALQDVYGTPDRIAAASGGKLLPETVIDHAATGDQRGLIFSYLDDHPSQMKTIGEKYYSTVNDFADTKIGNPSNIRTAAAEMGISPTDLYAAASKTKQGQIENYFSGWGTTTPDERKLAYADQYGNLAWHNTVVNKDEAVPIVRGNAILDPLTGAVVVIKNKDGSVSAATTKNQAMGGDQYHPAEFDTGKYVAMLKSDAYTKANDTQKQQIVTAFVSDKNNYVAPATAAAEGGGGGGRER